MKPKISVIVPVYNTAKYLKECLDSLLNQTLSDIEIICVNDGSTDDSLNILKEYASKDVRIKLLNQKNSGAAYSRNRALSFARAKYVQFLDSDDYYELNMLEKLYESALKNQADLVVCSANILDNKTGKLNTSETWPLWLSKVKFDNVFNWMDCPEDIFVLFHCNPWHKLWSKDLIVSNHLSFQDLSSSNDFSFDFIGRLYAKRIVIIKDKLVTYRVNRDCSISSYRWDNAINSIKALMCVKEHLLEKGIFSKLECSFEKLVRKSLCYEISSCNTEQHNNFLLNLKLLFADDYDYFKSMLPSDDVVNKINSFAKNKRVVLWGASQYLANVLNDITNPNPNILGVVDKSVNKWGTFCGPYKVFSPEKISELRPDAIILTVYNNNGLIYDELDKEIRLKYKGVDLLPNIFQQ